jgi:hypothetical protein
MRKSTMQDSLLFEQVRVETIVVLWQRVEVVNCGRNGAPLTYTEQRHRILEVQC